MKKAISTKAIRNLLGQHISPQNASTYDQYHLPDHDFDWTVQLLNASDQCINALLGPETQYVYL